MPDTRRWLALVATAILVALPTHSSSADTLRGPPQASKKATLAHLRVPGPPGHRAHLNPAKQQRYSFDSASMVGGTDAEEGVHPFHVGLMLKLYSDNYQNQFCGGTLVADRFVVTSADCSTFIKDAAREVEVIAGTKQLDGSGQRIAVTRVHVHPDYDRSTMDYNVAVWELASPVTRASFATLASTAPTTPGAPLRVTGWGTLNRLPKPYFPIDLQQGDIPLVPTADGMCGSADRITPRMICAGGPGNNTCFGDYGGPLTINRGSGFNELVGIGSELITCEASYPGIYTSVADSSINAFIRSVMSGNTRSMQFRNATPTVREGTRKVTFTVTRTSTVGTATVQYSTKEGSALPNSDFLPMTGTATFKPGSATTTFSIPILNDRSKERRERFEVFLSEPSSGWSIANNGAAEVMITDND